MMLDLIRREANIMNNEIRKKWYMQSKNTFILYSSDHNYEKVEKDIINLLGVNIDYICVETELKKNKVSFETIRKIAKTQTVTVLLANMDRTLWFIDYMKFINIGVPSINIFNYYQLSYLWTYVMQNDYWDKYITSLDNGYNEQTKTRKSYATFHNLQYCRQVYELLADEKSKKIFLRLITKRIMRCKFFDDVYSPDQYFDNDIIQLKSDEVFWDVGAFNGDTIFLFNKKVNGRYKAIYAFEPDDDVFGKLIENTKNVERINYLNLGLYSESGEMYFQNATLGSSHIVTSNIMETQYKSKPVLKGDSMNLQPTFIKMDIEGAEQNALSGLRETIKQGKPTLAICIYHQTDDLWKIPLYIKSIDPEYKLFIRHHSYTDCETVCYAVK